MNKNMRIREEVHKSSGNVFADIGLANPERVRSRAEIMFFVTQLIEKRGLTQKQASEILNIPQSKVSCLMNGKLSLFSLDHLFEFLNALNENVRINMFPKMAKERNATTRVIINRVSRFREIPNLWANIRRKPFTIRDRIISRQPKMIVEEPIFGYVDISPKVTKSTKTVIVHSLMELQND